MARSSRSAVTTSSSPAPTAPMRRCTSFSSSKERRRKEEWCRHDGGPERAAPRLSAGPFRPDGAIMIKSMTGFASVTREDERATMTVTIKSLNHRYLDLQLRIPQSLAALEPDEIGRAHV